MRAIDVAVIVPMAIGMAFSPAVIIEMILVLFSKRRVVNTITFVITLTVLTALGLAIGAFGSTATGTGEAKPSVVSSVVMLALGLLLLVLGISNWRKRRDTTEPKVFKAIGNMGPAAVAFLGLGATFVNPKNLPLLLSGGNAVAQAPMPWLAGALFIVIAISPYLVAMLVSLIGGEKAKGLLDRWRAWLLKHNRIIMALLCGGLGILIVVKSLGAILG